MIIYQDEGNASWYIHIIGCGTTGGYFAMSLARAAKLMPRPICRVILWDADKVDRQNLGQQIYCEENSTDAYKAIELKNLMMRVNPDLSVIFRTVSYGPGYNVQAASTSYPHKRLTVVCVDNIEARRYIMEKQRQIYATNGHLAWIIDIGHNVKYGQVVVSGLDENKSPIFYDQLLNLNEVNAGSCTEHERMPGMIISRMLGDYATWITMQLITGSPVENCLTMYSLDGKVARVPATQEAVANLLGRR